LYFCGRFGVVRANSAQSTVDTIPDDLQQNLDLLKADPDIVAFDTPWARRPLHGRAYGRKYINFYVNSKKFLAIWHPL